MYAGSTTTKIGCGQTLGKGLNNVNKAHGAKMRIEISKEKRRAKVADQSSKLSSELGIIARNILPVPTKWKELSEEDKTCHSRGLMYVLCYINIMTIIQLYYMFSTYLLHRKHVDKVYNRHRKESCEIALKIC